MSAETFAVLFGFWPSHGGIKDLTGIGFFTAVELLSCGNNQLTSLDLSKNTALKTFACHNNQLTTLDLSKNTALTFVNVTGNPLTSIDISTLKNLETLYCGRQDLSVINYTNNTSLKDLGIVNSDITTLDVSMLPELKTLQCEGCQLTTLDVSKNTKLNRILCGRNHIRGAGMDALINSLPTVTNGGLYVYDNEAPDGNEMTTAQVAAARAKGWNPQYCVSPGTYVDYEGVDASGIAIDATNFPDPEFRTMLLLQDYGQDGLLTNDEIAALTFLDVYWTTIVDLKGIEFFTEVKELYCRNLSLETLDVSQLKKLETLMCQGNQLTSIKVSGCPALKELICYGNKLTSLDVSDVPNLQWLYCYDNNINETEMGKLVESLPTVEGGLFIVKNLDSGASDKNVITQEQVAAATAKHWAVQAMSNGKMEFYDGVPSGIEGVKGDTTGSGSWYMLDGQKLQGAPAKKGEYIQDGRKIIIK